MAVNGKKKGQEPEAEFETPTGGPLRPPKEGEEIFLGEAKSLTVTKDVNIGQLLDEIDERLNDSSRYHVVAHIERDEDEVTEENPLTLYVHGDADMRTVRGVVESHVRDDSYGVSDEERTINELKDKLKAGDDLPPADLNKLLRSML